jgi:hypothetical protein
MCLVPVWVCPNCERVTPRYSARILGCSLYLCTRIAEPSLEKRLRNEPCSPYCLSERCTVLTAFRYCLDPVACARGTDPELEQRETYSGPSRVRSPKAKRPCV